VSGAHAPVIRAELLTKRYGADRGVEDLSFEVAQGEVFGYLGPNGAGKTTTLRLLLDLIRPTSGTVSLFGLDARRDGAEARSRVGYLPGDLRLYEKLTGREQLRFFSRLRRFDHLGDADRLAQQLDVDLDRPIRDLSKGNRQKVCLLQALMHRPDLLVLDEPTSGLDPLVQQEFYALVDETRARGGTVFLSSHVMPEVERVCDRVAIIREGRLITVDEVSDLKERALRKIVFHFDRPVPADNFSHVPSVVSAEAQGDTVALSVRGPVDEVVKEAARHTVVNVTSEEPSLEDIFLEVYRDGRGPGGGGP
jgi:ABC-2 type transport system ATP-binding protein